MICQLLAILLLLILGGCGYTSDHALGSHTESKFTFLNLSSVIVGNVVGGADGNSVNLGSSLSTSSYPKGNFYFRNVAASLVNAGVTVSARIENGEELRSFLKGTATRANVTETVADDWHGATGLALEVTTIHGQEVPLESFVSINPFTNLAYWLSNPSSSDFYSEFKNQLVVLNEIFLDRPLAPGCRADKGLCPEHRQFLDAGNSFKVSNDGFRFFFTTPGFNSCEGLISGFPSPCFKEISSARRKRL